MVAEAIIARTITEASPRQIAELTHRVAALCFDRRDSAYDDAYDGVIETLDRDFEGGTAVPPWLANDQIEDFLVGRAFGAGISRRGGTA